MQVDKIDEVLENKGLSLNRNVPYFVKLCILFAVEKVQEQNRRYADTSVSKTCEWINNVINGHLEEQQIGPRFIVEEMDEDDAMLFIVKDKDTARLIARFQTLNEANDYAALRNAQTDDGPSEDEDDPNEVPEHSEDDCLWMIYCRKGTARAYYTGPDRLKMKSKYLHPWTHDIECAMTFCDRNGALDQLKKIKKVPIGFNQPTVEPY